MRLKIVVPTKDSKGLDDVVSEVFAKAKTFTIVEIENGQIRNVQVIDNPAASYEHGSGPVVAKMLADLKVDYVLAAEIGPGASELLEHHRIKRIPIKPNIKVSDIIEEALTRLKIT
jgi:predicted Fe-Mo cluster-binding NifX family protein